MYARSWELIVGVGGVAALGTLLLLVACGAGWALGRQPSLPPVRLVDWWVRHVVLPLATLRVWWGRCLAIFTNNVIILAALLGMGRWPVAPLFGVAAVGISFGIALRVMSNMPLPAFMPAYRHDNSARYRVTLGVALNLLEPPAILLTVGLSLARAGMALPAGEVWQTFILWVVPATLVAAGGEALWIGARQDANARHDHLNSQNTDGG